MSDTSDFRNTAYEFFWLFARFECAVKETGRKDGYLKRGKYDLAEPHWKKIQKNLGTELDRSQKTDVQNAIKYLTECPPMAQKVSGNYAVFQKDKLRSKGLGSQAIEAAKRVRNNLFHGGKCRPPEEQERDPTLIRHSTAILEECLKIDKAIAGCFQSISR